MENLSTLQVNYTDRFHARLCIDGREVIEFFMDCITDVAQIVAEAIRRAPSVRALAKLYVRNMTQGGCAERRVMLRGESLFAALKTA